MTVHNHGPEEGAGLSCNELRLPDGSLRGACMMAAFTSHGYHIPGTGPTTFTPKEIFRCGGPEKCARCKSEVESSMAYARAHRPVIKVVSA